MSVITKDLGVATAYGYAKSKGYTGTEEEFAELMASYADVAQQAEAAAQDAEDAKDEAVTAKTDAQIAKTAAQAAQSAAETASGAASTKASEAAQSAQAASGSATAAQTSATAAAGSAQTAQAAAQTATTKASEASSSASAASTAKTGAETARTGAQTAQTAAETAQANAEAAASSVSASAAQIEQNTADIGAIKNDLNAVNNAFEDGAVVLPLSAFASGYINESGTVTANSNTEYASTTIGEDLIGKTLLISGSAWWALVPYVFVANDSSIAYADVPSPSGDETQYTNIEFVPQKAGTLYVNRYTNGTIVRHIARAMCPSASNLKSAYVPNTAGDMIDDAVSYRIVPLTMAEGKILRTNNGMISDIDGAANRVSQFVEVNEGSYYLLSTEHFWGNGLYAWYDKNKEFISAVAAEAGSTVTKLYCERIKSPKNAKYLVIGYLYQASFMFPFLMEGQMNSIDPSKRWSGKKWVCLGDSLTQSYNVTGAHYFDLIKAATGINVVNMGVSGTGYARGTDNFMTRALNVPSDADVVTIFGSFNDLGAGLPIGSVDDTGTDTLAGCINTTITNIQSVIPLANLGIVAPTPWEPAQPTTSGANYNYVEMIKAICARRSIPFLDLWRCSNLRPWDADFKAVAYTHDNGNGVHPDEHGHMLIAPRFKAFLETLLM